MPTNSKGLSRGRKGERSMPKCQIFNKEWEKVYPTKMEKWEKGKLRELKANLCRKCLKSWVTADLHEDGVYSKTYPQGVLSEEEERERW